MPAPPPRADSAAAPGVLSLSPFLRSSEDDAAHGGEGRARVAVIQLQNVRNVRDLGGIVTEDGRVVKPGLFYRGAALYEATDADKDALFNQLGIRCVIDVRCGWEREAKPDVTVPGVENLHVPFYDLDRVGVEYTEPAAGTKVVGRDVACDPIRFYGSLSNVLTARQMRKGVHDAFSHALEGKPVYVHCSGGKDRAGVLSVLILAILGVGKEAILRDYLITNESRDRHYESEFQRFLRFADGNEELAHKLTRAHRANPENLQAFYDSLEARYGGMDAFIVEKLGIDRHYRAKLHEQLTVPAC